MKVKIEIDGEVKFCHNNFEKIDYSILVPKDDDEDEDEDGKTHEEPVFPVGEFEKFDLDEYTVPSVVSRILKTTKLREAVQVRTTRKDKLSTHFEEDH